MRGLKHLVFIKNIGWRSMNLFLLFDVCVVTRDTCEMPHQKNACSRDNLFTSGNLWAKINTISSKLMSNLSVVSEIVASWYNLRNNKDCLNKSFTRAPQSTAAYVQNKACTRGITTYISQMIHVLTIFCMLPAFEIEKKSLFSLRIAT